MNESILFDEEQSYHGPAVEPLSCFQVWTSPRAWLMFFPICYLIIQGNFHPPTISEKLRLALQSDTFLGRWGLILLVVVAFTAILSRLSVLLPKILAVKDLVAFAFLALVSALWSDLPRRSLFNGLGLLAVTLLAVYVVSEFSPYEQMQLLILPGFLVLVLSAGAALFVPIVGVDTDGGGAWRGIFQQKNVLGLVALFLAMPFVHLQVTGAASKCFRAIYLVLAFALVGMSRAKAAWSVAVLYVAFAIALKVLRRFERRDAAILTLLLAIGSVLLAAGINQNRASFLEVLGKDSTISERTIIWAAVWDQIANRPLLGYGFAAFWRGVSGPSLNVVLTSGWLVGQAQNGYLDVWLQLGVVGILMLAIILLRVARYASVCLQLSNDASVRWYCAILFCSLIYNLGESFLGDPRHICWFLLTIACVGLNQTASRRRGWNQVVFRRSSTVESFIATPAN